LHFKSHYYLQIRFEIQRISQLPIKTLIFKGLEKILGFVVGVALLPATILFHLIGFRYVNIFTNRIGHLALEPDTLLKAENLGLISGRKWIILAPPGQTANTHLLSYWSKHFIVFSNYFACFFVKSMVISGLMKYDVTKYLRASGETQAAYEIQKRWGGRQPLLKLTGLDLLWGDEQFKSLGLPVDVWFVCVHVRENGFSPVDDEIQCYRNGSITKIIPAIEEITRRGGWVIRIGDSNMEPLPKLPNVIDYAHHPMKSDRLDVILCARARFILGNTSGIALVGTVFGVACALANIAPVSVLWFMKDDISIPKMHWSFKLNRYLRLDELLESDVATFQFSKQFEYAGIRLEENKPEDIVNLVKEMFDQISGQSEISPLGRYLQNQVKSMFKQNFHYGYNSAANMAASFLCDHPELLKLES